MKCTLRGCVGEYEERRIVHTVRSQGQLVVVDNAPAEVCSVCGDVLLRPDTLRHIELILEKPSQPISTVPLFGYV